MLLPKSFAATTSVVPPIDILQKESAGLGAVKSSILRNAMDVGGISDMYVGILRSRSVADAIIERFDLATVYGSKITFPVSGKFWIAEHPLRLPRRALLLSRSKTETLARRQTWPMLMSKN